ncbi:hypothetical protein GCM10009634_21260 [Saccharothrix xinjiangensis]
MLVQNYYRDTTGRLRWREDEQGSGLPPSALRIVSPYDPTVRYARRGQVTRRQGFLAHVAETCSGDSPNVITDVATMPATSTARAKASPATTSTAARSPAHKARSAEAGTAPTRHPRRPRPR